MHDYQTFPASELLHKSVKCWFDNRFRQCALARLASINLNSLLFHSNRWLHFKGSGYCCRCNLEKALLIFHSPVDEAVSIDNAAHIYKLARHPKSFVSLDDADHLLTDEEDAKYVGSVTAAWGERYFT